MSRDICKILFDNAKVEAFGKIKMIPHGEHLGAYGVLYRWFTDVSGLDLAEQARILMLPDPPKKEEELAEHVETCSDKMCRLEAHGAEFRLAPISRSAG